MTGDVWIASDLHLSPAVPERTARFARFLDAATRGAAGLYLLGDLFDYWIGPRHALLPDYREVLAPLARVRAAGFPISIVPGNRDFLLEAGGAPAALRVLPERARVRLGGVETLLTHGDLLCTDDRSYQRWRRVARSGAIGALARALPAPLARQLGARLRRRSAAAIARKTPAQMDVTPRGIRAAFAPGVEVVVCGHVHRQQMRRIPLGDGRAGRLYVLGAWEGDAAPYLEITPAGRFTFRDLPPR